MVIMSESAEDVALKTMSENQLVRLRAELEMEMKRRGIAFSVGNIGEELILQHFNATPGLPNLQLAPPGTKNVDALSRNGDRYSIKTLWNAKKTGTIYPDPQDPDKRLFEVLLIAHLNDDLSLRSIHEFTWDQFVEWRHWDKRMSAWYVGCSRKTLGKVAQIL